MTLSISFRKASNLWIGHYIYLVSLQKKVYGRLDSCDKHSQLNDNHITRLAVSYLLQPDNDIIRHLHKSLFC